VRPRTFEALGDADSPVPDALRPVLAELREGIRLLEERIEGTERQLQALARQTPAVERLLTIPGIGLLAATALVAFVGDIHRFPSARHFASYLGLTPREFSSALKRRRGRISKRGDVYLRALLMITSAPGLSPSTTSSPGSPGRSGRRTATSSRSPSPRPPPDPRRHRVQPT
jgi:transposase